MSGEACVPGQTVGCDAASVARLAGFVATLGRGPGRSRALTRDEAREALGLVLDRRCDPMQVGAFLMLLRYRGEDADEVAGLVEAARAETRLRLPGVRLDWPSYGAGRTRGAPWFLLAALALGRAGLPVLMHGSNAFSSGMSVADGLAALGLAVSAGRDEAAMHLADGGFAYLPLGSVAPMLEQLLGTRRLFGLRSPINTVCRLLNPADASASVDGVFHPPYIEVHLGAAERLGGSRLLVLKGGGGEAERNPAKPAALHLAIPGQARRLLEAPALGPAGDGEPDPALFRAIWQGTEERAPITARIVATVALGLLAVGRAETVAHADAEAAAIWQARLSPVRIQSVATAQPSGRYGQS